MTCGVARRRRANRNSVYDASVQWRLEASNSDFLKMFADGGWFGLPVILWLAPNVYRRARDKLCGTRARSSFVIFEGMWTSAGLQLLGFSF